MPVTTFTNIFRAVFGTKDQTVPKGIAAALTESRLTGEEWRPIGTAPRDGTIVETKCTYGVLPWYGLHQWVGGHWQDARDELKGVGEDSLLWRPYSGDAQSYVDPTGGAQDDGVYWRAGVALKYGLRPDHFEK